MEWQHGIQRKGTDGRPAGSRARLRERRNERVWRENASSQQQQHITGRVEERMVVRGKKEMKSRWGGKRRRSGGRRKQKMKLTQSETLAREICNIGISILHKFLQDRFDFSSNQCTIEMWTQITQCFRTSDANIGNIINSSSENER